MTAIRTTSSFRQREAVLAQVGRGREAGVAPGTLDRDELNGVDRRRDEHGLADRAQRVAHATGEIRVDL